MASSQHETGEMLVPSGEHRYCDRAQVKSTKVYISRTESECR